MDKYSTCRSELISENPYWKYLADDYILPNFRTGKYYYVDSPGSVLVVPKIGADEFVMVRQYRYLSRKISLEFPGGGMIAGTSPEENAIRELCEETGCVAASMRKIGEFNPCVGLTNEICNVFFAEISEQKQTKFDESEEIEIVRLHSGQIDEMIADGTVCNGMTIAAWGCYQTSRKISNKQELNK